MGNITTIVVADAATTPVNHTYTPVKIDGDTGYFLDTSASNSLGYRTLSVTQRAPLAGQTEKVYRSKISHSMPVTYDETINGVARPVLAYTLRFNGEFVIPAAATSQNRKDIRKTVYGMLNDTLVKACVEDQVNLY